MTKPYNPPESPEALKEAARLREVMQLEARVDRAYTQRNNAAVALVRMALLLGWPAGRGLDDLTDNAPEWRHVVYLDLPNGEQVSYHMAPADVPLLDGLPEYTGKWDGKFTGTTAWAGMVPVAESYENGTKCGMCHQGVEGCRDNGCGFLEAGNGEPGTGTEQFLEVTHPSWPQPIVCEPFPGLQYFGSETARIVPKEPFPPGVCACPKCEQPRESGKLFCAPHQSVDGRFPGGPITNEQLAYMMQRDGEQQ